VLCIRDSELMALGLQDEGQALVAMG